MLRFFFKKKDLKSTTKYLANQLEFLNGNYTALLLDPAKGNKQRDWMNAQLDYYLRRFFAKYSARLLVRGGRVSYKYGSSLCDYMKQIKYKSHAFSVNGDYGYGSTANVFATCLLYFVDSFEELKNIHQQTMSRVKESRRWPNDPTIPTPPIIIITRRENSPLRDAEEIRQLIDIPILDSWHLDQPRYVLFHKGTTPEMSNKTWVRIMKHIELIYSQLAIARGLIHKKVIDAQAAFLLCTDELNQQDKSCPDVQNLIAYNLFRFNVNKAMKKPEDFTTEPTVTYGNYGGGCNVM